MTLSQEEQQPPFTEEGQALLTKWTDDMEENTWDDEDDRYTSHVYFQHIKDWFAHRDTLYDAYARTVLSAKYLGTFGGPISRYAFWKVLCHHKDLKHIGENNLSSIDYVYLYQNCSDQETTFNYLDIESKDVRQTPDLEKVKKYTELWKDE